MTERTDLVERILTLVGDEILQIEDLAQGWPTLGSLTVEGSREPVALYAGRVGLGGRGRDDVERRFQNPAGGVPLEQNPHRRLLLLGLWESDSLIEVERPLLVSADPYRRIGDTTRYSVWVGVVTLRAALAKGWAEGVSASDELVRCFVPPLLSISFASDRDAAVPSTASMQAVIEGSGLLTASEPEVPTASERARRAGSTLIRDARFSRRVVDAYGGLCAMCGLDFGLVQAAHIYPVSAPSSSDEPWNGLALCPNHHFAFDRHVVGVRPGTNEVVFEPSIAARASESPAAKVLISGTFTRLAEPYDQSARPRRELFEQRYEFFADQYGWLTSS